MHSNAIYRQKTIVKHFIDDETIFYFISLVTFLKMSQMLIIITAYVAQIYDYSVFRSRS